MELKHCPRCGKLFTYVSVNLCTNCIKQDDDDFEKVRDYIKENPGRNLSAVAEATEVDKSKIMKFIKEGKLETSDGMQGEIVCDSCGKPIQSGRYCKECATKLNNEVMEAFGKNNQPVQQTKERQGAKMHITKRL